MVQLEVLVLALLVLVLVLVVYDDDESDLVARCCCSRTNKVPLGPDTKRRRHNRVGPVV